MVIGIEVSYRVLLDKDSKLHVFSGKLEDVWRKSSGVW
jgi:hypothetical protein